MWNAGVWSCHNELGLQAEAWLRRDDEPVRVLKEDEALPLGKPPRRRMLGEDTKPPPFYRMVRAALGAAVTPNQPAAQAPTSYFKALKGVKVGDIARQVIGGSGATRGPTTKSGATGHGGTRHFGLRAPRIPKRR
jgi:hypothetical protein